MSKYHLTKMERTKYDEFNNVLQKITQLPFLPALYGWKTTTMISGDDSLNCSQLTAQLKIWWNFDQLKTMSMETQWKRNQTKIPIESIEYIRMQSNDCDSIVE